MKNIIFIFSLLLVTSSLRAQQLTVRTWEPEKTKVNTVYQDLNNTLVNIYIRDNRTTSKQYSDLLKRYIAKNIQESFPKANIKFVTSLRDVHSTKKNKIFLLIKINEYFVNKRGNKWISRTSFNVTIFDARQAEVKKYTKPISHTSTISNRRGLQAAKMSLLLSFHGANKKLTKYLSYCALGKEKFELVNKSQTKELSKKKPNNNKQNIKTSETLKTFQSDIDSNIPVNNTNYENRYALIIGNEDYSTFQASLNNESNVDYAKRDAEIFKQYAIKTMSIPEENIIFLSNAKFVEFNKAIDKLNIISKNTDGKAELLFYYAGHGLPDENTKEAYLIPVDVSGTDLQYAISLKHLYSKLAEYPAKRITVFLDACFSGGSRNQGLIANRAIKIKPKENVLKGNIVVFSASTNAQSSLPYKEQEHGIFTYFLLKKIQETKGDISYSKLSEYLNKQVAIKSVIINSKEQNPQINVSTEISDDWKNWTIK